MKLLRTGTLLLALTSTACLENEENLTIRADGSVTQEIMVKGNTVDLADGYPIALRGAWRPVDRQTREWLEKVGSETGGVETLRKVEEELVLGEDLDADRMLRATRDFADVTQLPGSFADPLDPYADAYLQRSAQLEVIETEGRKVFVFERTYLARPYGFEFFDRVMEAEENEGLWEQFSNGELPEEETEKLFDMIERMHSHLATTFMRNALVDHYIIGSAILSAEAMDAATNRLQDDVATIFNYEKLRTFAADENREDSLIWLGLMSEFRDGIRGRLTSTLEEANVPPQERYAILFALEREFTAYDHSSDIGDESFRCNVKMPGKIVTGNFDAMTRSTSTAHWEFEGSRIWTGDVTLRVVSVLD